MTPLAPWRWLALTAAAVAALVVAVDAYAASPADMNRVASIFAMRPVTIACATPETDANLTDAWGYTYLTWDFAVMRQELCDALEHPTELWSEAVAVAVLVHESYHMRLWPLRANEAVVECRAIRHFKVGARLLGIPPDRVALLLPWALMEHWRLAALVPEYFQVDCKVPNPW